MKKVIWILFLLISVVLLPKTVFAQSGCCSHHSGVCGCKCCDGSSLSAICAPNYPSCNSAPAKPYVPPTTTTTPSPAQTDNNITAEPQVDTTTKATGQAGLTAEPKTTISSTPEEKPENNSDGTGAAVGGLAVLAGTGAGAGWIYKKFKK